MPKRYIVRLSEEEQQSLKELVSTGKAAAYKIKRANILLTIDVSPVLMLDEQPMQLVKETGLPRPAKPGHREAVDYEYERNGTATIFLFTEPLAGWRKVVVSERRTTVDWANQTSGLARA